MSGKKRVLRTPGDPSRGKTTTPTFHTHAGYRKPQKQVVDRHVRWMSEGYEKEPSFPVGEYLGDIKITAKLLAGLKNINPFVNSIGAVKRGTYIVMADFDYAGDGHFIGLRLEPLEETAGGGE